MTEQTQIRPITPDAYSTKSWRRFEQYGFAAASPVVLLSAAEVGTAVLSMPLAFVETGDAVSVAAVLGLVPGQNLFVAPDGKWAGQYVPAVLRSYPFKLAKIEDGDLTLCFDESSGLLAEAGEGESFFDEEGKPSEAIQKILEFQVKVSRGLEAIASASNLLNKHALLEPWALKVKDDENEREVGGLLKVNEAKLNALDDEAFLELRNGGALQVAFAQLLSMPNIALLGRLAQMHASYKQRQAAPEIQQKSRFQATDGDGAIDFSKFFGG